MVKDSINDVLEYQRLEKDLEELEKNISGLESTLRIRKKEVENENTDIQIIERDVQDLRELCDASKRWVELSSRIALQRDQVNQKEADFRIMNPDREGRDLKQVEAELLESNRKKDDYNGAFLSCLTFRTESCRRIVTLTVCFNVFLFGGIMAT